MAEPTTPPTRRRWFQNGLGEIFVLLTLLAVVWWQAASRPTRKQFGLGNGKYVIDVSAPSPLAVLRARGRLVHWQPRSLGGRSLLGPSTSRGGPHTIITNYRSFYPLCRSGGFPYNRGFLNRDPTAPGRWNRHAKAKNTQRFEEAVPRDRQRQSHAPRYRDQPLGDAHYARSAAASCVAHVRWPPWTPSGSRKRCAATATRETEQRKWHGHAASALKTRTPRRATNIPSRREGLERVRR